MVTTELTYRDAYHFKKNVLSLFISLFLYFWLSLS